MLSGLVSVVVDLVSGLVGALIGGGGSGSA